MERVSPKMENTTLIAYDLHEATEPNDWQDQAVSIAKTYEIEIGKDNIAIYPQLMSQCLLYSLTAGQTSRALEHGQPFSQLPMFSLMHIRLP